MRISLLLITILAPIFLSAQILDEIPWNSSKSEIQAKFDGITYKDTYNEWSIKTKLYGLTTLAQFTFENNQLISIRYDIKKSGLTRLEYWEIMKKLVDTINQRISTESEYDKEVWEKVYSFPDSELKNIEKVKYSLKRKWKNDSLYLNFLMFSFNRELQTNIILNPGVAIESVEEKPKENIKQFNKEIEAKDGWAAFADSSTTEIEKESKTESESKTTEPKETVYEKIRIGGNRQNRFYYKGNKMNTRDFMNVTIKVPKAYKYAKKANTNRVLDVTLSVVGGALMGWTIGQSFTVPSNSFNPTPGAVGLVMALATIPLTIGTKKNLRKSARLYNNGIGK